MSETDALDHLARAAGIEDGWWDFFGQWRVVPPETKRAFLRAMRFAVESEAEIQASLHELETRPWRRWVEPVAILDEHAPPPDIVLSLPAATEGQLLDWVLEEETGALNAGTFRPEKLELLEEREVDGGLIRRRRLTLPALPPVGVHSLRVHGPDDACSEQTLIVAPARAWSPPAVSGGRKAWGLATQVYALREADDWGLGTYGALARLAKGAASIGAAAIGVNPLHALFPEQPDRFSPYASSSRSFLSTHLIDVARIPDFEQCGEAQKLVASPAFQARAAELRGLALIDYPAVAALTAPVLTLIYNHVEAGLGDEGRRQAFEAFCHAGEARLRRFAAFQALHERFLIEGNGYWPHWPVEYQDPGSEAVEAFASAHPGRIGYYQWLQFIADEQLAQAQAAGKTADTLGLYRDLGVGVTSDGAEAWSEQAVMARGVSVGAPPDPLAPQGQDWGLVPFDPIRLREAAYQPFRAVLAANMRHAGALRLDHAMALQRLYWVPPGVPADQGAYVRYPFEDLRALVALESLRAECLVIGEDLGNVPEGFREKMEHSGLFAYRVAIFEKGHDGRFKAPEDYDAQALSIFATHDLPSMRGWWNGADIDLRARLGVFPRPEMAGEWLDGRRWDREVLVAALVGRGLLPEGFPVTPDLSDEQAELLAKAAHAFLGQTNSGLAMVQIEDVLALDGQMNLPGTVDEHPNWRSRFPVEVAAVMNDPRLAEVAARMTAAGRGLP